MSSIDYSLDPLLWTPTKPKKLVEEPYYDLNIPQVIWIIGQPRCLPLDEYVYTSNGVVEVKDVYEGMPILGGYVSKPYVFEDEVYEIMIGKIQFRANGEHPIWIKTNDGKEKWRTIKYLYEKYQDKKNPPLYAKFYTAQELGLKVTETIEIEKYTEVIGKEINKKDAYQIQYELWRTGQNSHVIKSNDLWQVILDDELPRSFIEIKSIMKIGKKQVCGWKTENSNEIISYNGLKTHNSGKGFAMDQFLEFDKKAGMTRIYIFSAGGHESLYLAINKDCRKRWNFVKDVLKILIKSQNTPIEQSELKATLDFKDSDKTFEKYIMLATDLKAIEVNDDFVSITDVGKNIVNDEPLHCNCYKPRNIMVMLPPYVTPVQETVDRFNGWYWSGKEEYYKAYFEGKVTDYIPDEPWIDFTKIPKPVNLRPVPAMVFKHITLPMTPAKVDIFRKEFRQMMLECRNEDRDLVNSPSFFTGDHMGKLEKYTLVAEILKYLPELSQKDFAPLRLDKPRSEYTPKEKSWHKISVIANEVRALAPSNRLSAEPESSVSKRAWFGFLPERRHSKCWVKADMQSSEDFFIGSRNQNDLWVIKRITTSLLGENFKWLEDAITEKRQRIFDYYKSDKGQALETANKSWPKLSEIPDNKAYVLFGNREFKLIKIYPPSWHHKSDVGDDFFADTGIEFIKDKQREEIEKSSKSEETKKSAKNSIDKNEEMMLIHQMKTDGKKFPDIIKYFQDKAKLNNEPDSKWFEENKKNLSNKYNYWLKSQNQEEKKD